LPHGRLAFSLPPPLTCNQAPSKAPVKPHQWSVSPPLHWPFARYCWPITPLMAVNRASIPSTFIVPLPIKLDRARARTLLLLCPSPHFLSRASTTNFRRRRHGRAAVELFGPPRQTTVHFDVSSVGIASRRRIHPAAHRPPSLAKSPPRGLGRADRRAVDLFGQVFPLSPTPFGSRWHAALESIFFGRNPWLFVRAVPCSPEHLSAAVHSSATS
jgi:hypothetical protein